MSLPFLDSWYQAKEDNMPKNIGSSTKTSLDTEDPSNYIFTGNKDEEVFYLKKTDGLKAYIVSTMLRYFVDEDASPEEKLIIEDGVVKNASKIVYDLTEINGTKEIKEKQDITRLAKMMAVIEVCGEVDPNILNFCRNSDGKIVKIDHNYSLEDTISIPEYYANNRIQTKIIDYFKDNILFQTTLKKTIEDIKQFDVKHLFSKENLGKELYDALYKEQIEENDSNIRVAEKCKEGATQFGVHKEPDHPSVLLTMLQNRIQKKSAQYGVSDDNDDVVVPESNKPELVRNPKKHTQKKSAQYGVSDDNDDDDVVVPELNKEPKKLRLPNISKEPNKLELGPSITLKSLNDCQKDEKKKVTFNDEKNTTKFYNKSFPLDSKLVNPNKKHNPILNLFNKYKYFLKPTPLSVEQKSIEPKVHFGLNPKYKNDNRILGLYYKAKKYSLALLPKPHIEGASPEFKKIQNTKKATLGTDSGLRNRNEQDLFNIFFYKMLKTTALNTNRGGR